jgi:hypothetical protein
MDFDDPPAATQEISPLEQRVHNLEKRLSAVEEWKMDGDKYRAWLNEFCIAFTKEQDK